jgi:quinohemoprotein ethanol dehydrogenase
LGLQWISEKFENGGTSQVTPVVKGGVMFITAGRYVYALNAKTGQRIWTFNTLPDVNVADVSAALANTDSTLLTLANGRGVSVGQELVFIGLLNGRVIALKSKTGELAWSRQTGTEKPRKGQKAAVAPTYVAGIVLSGLSDGDNYVRGRMTALNAASGTRLWQKYTIPAPGDPGSESWPAFNDTWAHGGGGVWTQPPVDTSLNMAYFTAGNATPAYAGDLRPGNNLYTTSVLALSLNSGDLHWYYQLVHHDVFEMGVGTPAILYDARVGSRVHEALAVMRADRYLFQLDRKTGVPLQPVEERAVPQSESQQTSPTQPFPVNGESILMGCEDWRKEQIPTGFVVGCAFTPAPAPPPSHDAQNVLVPFPSAEGRQMAYSPKTGYFYAQAYSSLYWPRRAHDPYFLDFTTNVPGLRGYLQLTAIDSRTGRIAWKKIWSNGAVGGRSLLATVGNLLFDTSADGVIDAYNAYTGNMVWQFQTGATGGNGALSSYEVDGEQYIAATMGSAVWAFKLGGALPAASPQGAALPREDFSGPVLDTNEIETASLRKSVAVPGSRYFEDEFALNPYRARVTAGDTVTFINNGLERHELAALDGSWSTGSLGPTQQAWVKFDKPCVYPYHCKDHSWTYGQIVVTPGAAQCKSHFIQQSKRGRESYGTHCSVCHGENLDGREAAPALAGSLFVSHWGNSAVADLFDRIRTTMPQTSPGSLDRQAYLDIVAYLLQVNDMKTDRELIDDAQTLRSIKIESSAESY